MIVGIRVVWQDILWRRDEITSIWPDGAVPANTNSLQHEVLPRQHRSRGGRPLKFDWPKFDREMIRIANTPDGLPERPLLQKQMMVFCHAIWGDEAPAENTIRARIAELYPS